MDSSGRNSLLAKIRNAALIVGGMAIVLLGASRINSKGNPQSSATPLDGVAHADAPACAGDSTSAEACGCGDDGGC